MDKTAIIVLTVCALIFGWWMVEEKKIADQAARQQAVELASHTNQTATAYSPAPAPALPEVSASAAPFVQPATDPVVGAPEQILVVTNGLARFIFTSRGGGLAQVDLLQFPDTLSARWQTVKKSPSTKPTVASLNTQAKVPVLAVLGDNDLTAAGDYQLSRRGNTVYAQIRLPNGLAVTKQFEIGTNYLVNASVQLANTGTKSLNLPGLALVTGTATPMDVDDNGAVEGVMWSDGTSANDTLLPWFAGGGFGCQREPRSEYWGGSNNVVWVAAHNQYFALVAMPQEPAARVLALPVSLPTDTNVVQTYNAAAPRGVQAALAYPPVTLTAGSALDRHLTLYAGPKEYRALADIALARKNGVDQVMNFGYLGWFAKLLLLAMNTLHDVTTLGYGAVIVLITVLIKVIFWPLTAASTRSMKKMQLIAPEMKALQEKYKEDPQKLMAKQGELYKKHGVNPLSGCLPMLVQMPIFIGFFTMIRSAIELRGAHFLWVTDLSKPDTLFLIPGTGLPFNLLPLLMGGAMLWQAHLTPPSPGMDPAQQRIMRYMPLIFLVFLYNYSAGLALYWTVNNLLTILQTKLTRQQPGPTAPAAPTGPATNPALTPAAKLKK